MEFRVERNLQNQGSDICGFCGFRVERNQGSHISGGISSGTEPDFSRDFLWILFVPATSEGRQTDIPTKPPFLGGVCPNVVKGPGHRNIGKAFWSMVFCCFPKMFRRWGCPNNNIYFMYMHAYYIYMTMTLYA